MNRILNEYNYRIELSLLLKDENYDLSISDINSVIIDSDYDKNTMPAIIIGVSVGPDTYSKLVLNSDSAFISVRIYKYDSNTRGGIDSPYISGKFIYKMTDNPNYNESIINNSSLPENRDDISLEGYIALVSLDSINSNKKLYNTIVKNTDLLSMVLYFINHLNMCIEPFDNNIKIDQFIIPPITSLTNLLSYINSHYCFYKSGYRYFRDFNMTYLLSCKGKSIITNKDEYNTVLIDIVDPSLYSGYPDGIEIDDKSKSYIIHVTANSTSVDRDKYTDSSFNSIIGVDDKGDTDKIVLDIPKNPESTEKALIKRVNYDNMGYIYNIKYAVESKSLVVTVVKSNIDSSILTPNKEYLIKNYKDNRDYDGRFVLSYKKEVLFQSQDTFVSNIVFGLRKVSEDEG